MVFNSFQFMMFFAVVLAVYFSLPWRFRQVFLLLAGYYFYMCFKPENVIILVASTLIDYYLGLRIAASSAPARKRWFLLGLVHNIGMLAALKYLQFFSETTASLLQPLHMVLDVKTIAFLAPVGISYYTFKKISYLIDLYRESRPPETRLHVFALYVSFFPEIMAGPIDRASSLIPQLDLHSGFDYQRVKEGLILIAMGFFKKVVISDRLATFVSQVYNAPYKYEGASLLAATVYFSIQIYCDFSGYTDIALGIGKLLGIDLSENFNRPYFARSIGEFWKRWHMTLSAWLMDYLFLPIAYGISRKIKATHLLKIKAETWAYMIGIISTMILCGLWHGASWTFVFWGITHGLLLAISFGTKKIRKRANKLLGITKNGLVSNICRSLLTFGLVTLAWIFFRASTMGDALYIFTHLFSGWSKVLGFAAFMDAISLGLLKKELAVAAISLMLLFLAHLLQGKVTLHQWLTSQKIVVRWSIYLVLLLWILTFGESSAENFIYFKF